jgi:hypothetical protein
MFATWHSMPRSLPVNVRPAAQAFAMYRGFFSFSFFLFLGGGGVAKKKPLALNALHLAAGLCIYSTNTRLKFLKLAVSTRKRTIPA